MRVRARVSSMLSDWHDREVPWPQGWPPPRVHDEISVDGHVFEVQSVLWHPTDAQAFVSVVLAKR